MVARVTVVGSYPKPPQEGGQFRLRKTLQAVDRGEATADDVRAAQDALVEEVIREQAEAGIELVTDGQVRWDDGQTRFADHLDGFAIGGLIRYFDNNTYYRQPEVKAAVSRREPIVLDEYRLAAGVSPVAVKPVLTGPYTLAALSIDHHYEDRRALVLDLARALNDEARALAAAGATVIAVDEPALARIPGSPLGELEIFAEAAPVLVDGLDGVTTILQTYFGDVVEHGPDLFALPFDGFGLDFVAGPANVEAVHDFPTDKILQAGIIDARNTRLEPAERVARTMEELAEVVPPDRLWVSPSSGLEYLPREAAERKCRRLAEAAGAFREQHGGAR